MSQTPGKKRIIAYVIIFVLIAFLIVFFTQKRSMDDAYSVGASRADNIDFEMGSVTPLPEPVPSLNQKLTQQPLVDTNGDTSVVAAVVAPENDTIIQNQDKKVIKTGTIDMRVNSVETAIGEIKIIALQNNGDEVSSDFSKNNSYKEGYIVIKVPVNQYTKTFEQIKKIAPIVTHESSQTQDVTAQFIDLESRIKNKKDHENQLRSFFDKAEEVDELIQIESELARVRTEIEQMEGQLKYLKDQTQYSTINITLFEDAAVVVSDSWRPMQVVKDSFNTLIEKSTTLLNSVIRFTITSLPFIILFIVIVWFLYFTAKHIFGKHDDDKDKK